MELLAESTSGNVDALKEAGQREVLERGVTSSEDRTHFHTIAPVRINDVRGSRFEGTLSSALIHRSLQQKVFDASTVIGLRPTQEVICALLTPFPRPLILTARLGRRTDWLSVPHWAMRRCPSAAFLTGLQAARHLSLYRKILFHT